MPQLYQLQLTPPVDNTSALSPLKESSEFRLIESAMGTQLFVVDGSRLYGIAPQTVSDLNTAMAQGRELDSLIGELIDTNASPAISNASISPPPLRSLSLNVAQSCNMACSYCYADEGRFGGKARMMEDSVAFEAIDRLFLESDATEPVIVGFMGGEPLVNRKLVHNATRYAAHHPSARSVRFSLTTNGTLVTEKDVRLFHEFPFTVQVSIDGNRQANDRARPLRGGGSSYDKIIEGLDLFQTFGRPRQLSARVTVTPQTRDLPSILSHLLDLGFDDVGFAPVLVSPNPDCVFSASDFDSFLSEMKECGQIALAEMRTGKPFPFSNFTTALNEIHRGTHRPYPCGAGAAYLSVNAEGDVFACHRLIDDPAFAMGHVATGLNQPARERHLQKMHVDKMQPCQSCWARYLCGGGCYHEVSRRGRPGCDYIRGWIEFCISAYVELSSLVDYEKLGASDAE